MGAARLVTCPECRGAQPSCAEAVFHDVGGTLQGDMCIRGWRCSPTHLCARDRKQLPLDVKPLVACQGGVLHQLAKDCLLGNAEVDELWCI